MSWVAVGVICAGLVAFAVVLRLVLIHETRKAFRTMDTSPESVMGGLDAIHRDLQSIQATMDKTHGRIQQARLCVHEPAAREGGRPEEGA